MKIVGIDPGMKGGLALMKDGRDLIAVEKLPHLTVVIGSNGRKKKWIDVPVLHDILRKWKPDHVFLEAQFPLPGQGASSTFTIAFNYGALCSALMALDLEHTIVSARVWKPAVGVTGNDKRTSLAMATKLWPAWQGNWTSTRSDGPAEAALIAYYGLKTIIGGKHLANRVTRPRIKLASHPIADDVPF